MIASPDRAEGSLLIHQDARVYAGLFASDEAATLDLAPGRLGYVHVARGALHVNGVTLEAGDALKVSGESSLELSRGLDAEALVFDLPGE